MIPSLQTLDLARLLGAQRAAGTGASGAPLGGFELEVVHIAADERWDSEGRPDERIVIVMEGLGTVAVDDWRATLSPGHAALVPARRRVAAHADGGRALDLVLVALTPPLPVAVDAPDEAPVAVEE